MAKKELKKFFNLNSYEWWRNHRRVVTFGLFLSIFAYYLGTPIYKEAKLKDTCAKLNSSYQITGDEAMKKLNWVPKISLDELITEMIEIDLKEAQKIAFLNKEGF